MILISAPLPRSGHRIVIHGSDIYVVGGFNNAISTDDYEDEIWQESHPIFREVKIVGQY